MSLESHLRPSEPPLLQVYRHLLPRINTDDEFLNNYEKLIRGYEGEHTFYQLVQQVLPNNFIALYRLSLSYENSPFQIDSLLFCKNKIY